MKKVFVSGCYDILHAGHVEFFNQAKALGDYLIVSFASDEVLKKYKGRTSALPEKHKQFLLENIKSVDKVYKSTNLDDPVFDFRDAFIKEKADILVSTVDDRNSKLKEDFCKKHNAEYIQLPKTLSFEKISTTEIREKIIAPQEVPLRVDFIGGWLDVPKYSIEGAYVINCAITPKVSLTNWPYEQKAGLGGSGAYATLLGKNGVEEELKMGVGWQDPAVINETGFCVWRSGKQPILELKINPSFLEGKMSLLWTGKEHLTKELAKKERDYQELAELSKKAFEKIKQNNWREFFDCVNEQYQLQLKEGMQELPIHNEIAKKYCGSGHGGYAIYIFENEIKRNEFVEKNKLAKKIEPYLE